MLSIEEERKENRHAKKLESLGEKLNNISKYYLAYDCIISSQHVTSVSQRFIQKGRIFIFISIKNLVHSKHRCKGLNLRILLCYLMHNNEIEENAKDVTKSYENLAELNFL